MTRSRSVFTGTAHPNLLRYRCVLFDFSGTLAHVLPSTELFFARFLRQHGVEASMLVIRRALSERLVPPDGEAPYASAEALDRYWLSVYGAVLGDLGVPPATAMGTAREMLDAHEAADSYGAYPDALDAIRALKALGAEVGVVSNFGPSLMPKLRHLGFAGLLDHVTCSVDVGLAKPSRAFFEYVFCSHGLNPVDVLYVGDDPADDLQPCEKIGVACLLIERGARSGRPAHITTLHDVLPHAVGATNVTSTGSERNTSP